MFHKTTWILVQTIVLKWHKRWKTICYTIDYSDNNGSNATNGTLKIPIVKSAH